MWRYNYRGCVPDSKNDLAHYKYVRRYKKNGKWRYVYDIGRASYKLNGQTPSRFKEYSRFQDILGYDERDRSERASARYERARSNSEAVNRSTRASNTTREVWDFMRESTGKEAQRAYEAFKKTPLGRINSMKKTVRKGKNYVANVLDKLARKLRG